MCGISSILCYFGLLNISYAYFCVVFMVIFVISLPTHSCMHEHSGNMLSLMFALIVQSFSTFSIVISIQ